MIKPHLIISKGEWELWRWSDNHKKAVFSLRHKIRRFEVKFDDGFNVVAILRAPAGVGIYWKRLPLKLAKIAHELDVRKSNY